MPKLVSLLQTVNTKSPEAKLNKTHMKDNNGRLIEFNDKVFTLKGVNKDTKW